MKMDRTILKMKLTAFADPAPFFEKLTGIDLHDIPAQFQDVVERTWQLAKEHLEIGIVYKRSNIAEIVKGRVLLEELAEAGNGGVKRLELVGDMPPRILKDSKQIISCVTTLCGFTKLQEMAQMRDDTVFGYFLDAWGNTYMEAAQVWFGKYIANELKNEGMMRTHLWSPGQQGFELANQEVLFSILRPEEIGCMLTESLMIHPIKSASGIFGVVREGTREMLLPCDFCEFGATCPSSKRGCHKVI